MSQQIAHDIENIDRTEDVQTIENVDFTAMLLSDPILQGLYKHGFKKPSPIQLKAIPIGRCGFDLIIKAKSGTGKTAVFGIIALEMINVSLDAVQALILVPTREIAVQIQQVLLTIGCFIPGLQVQYFIGGTSVQEDRKKFKKCHIAVGAPGRVKHLIKTGHMKLETVQLFVLDEADKLMELSYQRDINFIYNKLQPRKQIIASSATYPDELHTFITNYMNRPCKISATTQIPLLLGIKQYISAIKSHLNVIQQLNFRTTELIRILESISFSQCIIFSNYQTRAETLATKLVSLGWPAIFVSGAQAQSKRLEAVKNLQEFKCRILSTTDLLARGIDAVNVDLVVNYEVPYNAETYLHRMGRAGRYGTRGICVTIANDEDDLLRLQNIVKFKVLKFPTAEKMPEDFWKCSAEDFDIFQLNYIKSEAIKHTETCLDIISQPKCKLITTDTCSILNTEITKNDSKATKNKQKSIDSELICSTLNQLSVSSDQIVDDSSLNNFNINESNDFEFENVENPFQNLEIVEKPLRNFENVEKPLQNLENVEKLLQRFENVKTPLQNLENDEKLLQNHENVEKLLQNLENVDAITKTDIKSKFSHLDSHSIIDILSKGNLDNIKESQMKRIKTNENPTINSKETHTNTHFETEAINFQNAAILNKNIALYNLTKLIVNDNEPISTDSVSSIDNILTQITQEDKVANPVLDPMNIVAKMLTKLQKPANLDPNMDLEPEKCLSDQNSKSKTQTAPNLESNTCGFISEHFDSKCERLDSKTNSLNSKNKKFVPKIENVVQQLKCGCPEILFKIVFTNALSENPVDWGEVLCETHSASGNLNAVDDENVMDETYNHDDEMESFYLNDNYDNDKSSDYDENMFVKAYDYALRDKAAHCEPKYVCFDAEATGYASGYSDQPPTKALELNAYQGKAKETQIASKHVNENYEEQYDYCSNVLSGSGPYFTDTDSFEKWHKKWQENLHAVRNFIQQDIFTNEVLRKRKNN